MTRPTIILGNSHSQITGLSSLQFKELKKALSYTVDPQSAYFGKGWVKTKSLLDAKGNFPSGLLSKVKECVKNVNITDNRVIPKSLSKEKALVMDLPFTPYKWQLDAVDKAYNAKRGGVIAATGCGKSLVIAMIAAKFNVRTLIVVPTLEIRKQLTADIETFFGKNKNIVVQNIDSAFLKDYSDFDLLMIDECHHTAAKTYQQLNKHVWNNIYYRFFFTATYFRNDTNEQLLFEGIAGDPVYELTYKEAIAKKYIVPVEAYYIDLPKQETDAYTWAEVYSTFVVNYEHRNLLIAKTLLSLEKAGKSTLCLVKELKHGYTLSDLTNLPFSNGQDEVSKDFIRLFNKGEVKTLIGTTGILGEGVDTKPCEYVIIAGLGKAKSAFLQQIGRGVRTYPGKETCKIVLFRDTSHKFTLRHYREQCKILKEELDIVPLKLEIL